MTLNINVKVNATIEYIDLTHTNFVFNIFVKNAFSLHQTDGIVPPFSSAIAEEP